MPDEILVTLAVPVPQVRLGDITDHAEGRLRVREIVQRSRGPWDLAGDPPDHQPMPRELDDPPRARRTVYARDRVRVWRPASAFPRSRAHARRIVSGDLVVRGWYKYYASHHATCSCGWQESNPRADAVLATQAWLGHKASVLTAAAHAEHAGLAAVCAAEDADPALLPVAWTFRSYVAEAHLDALPLDRARATATAWQQALTAPEGEGLVDEPYQERTTARGLRPAGTYLYAHGRGQHGGFVTITGRIPDTAAALALAVAAGG